MVKRILTKRFVLQIGFSCNARCRFCYYQDSLRKGSVKDYTTDEVKAKLREGRKLGKNMVDISGGEPTIRPDIYEIIRYAKHIGYKKICIITNGIRTSKKEVCDKLIEAGMNDILISTHSPIESEHDYLTNVKGSWKKIWETVNNLKGKNIELRFNATITALNFNKIDQLFELWKEYNPDAINLLVLNPSQQSFQGKDDGDITFQSYNEIGKQISKNLDKYEKDFKKINVRWLPFCLLKGHEKNIRTMWQKIYEDKEWDPYMNIKYNKGRFAVWSSFIAGVFLYPFKTPKFGKRDTYTWFNEVLTTFRGIYYYLHTNKCKKCSLKKICPGLPKDYVKKYGSDKTKLVPYKFKRTIDDPLYFCRENKSDFESLRS